MQIGSGTWDLTGGLTYVYQAQDYSMGNQTLGTVRLGRNNNKYSLGDRIDASQWIAFPLSPEISFSMRLTESLWGNIDGVDSDLVVGPTVVPTANTQMQGGFDIKGLLGLNYYCKSGPLKGHRLAVEGGVPLYEKLEGYQLETDWIITVGWQVAF